MGKPSRRNRERMPRRDSESSMTRRANNYAEIFIETAAGAVASTLGAAGYPDIFRGYTSKYMPDVSSVTFLLCVLCFVCTLCPYSHT